MKKKKTKNECVQCQEELKFAMSAKTDENKVAFYVCTNPACPNYSLVSVGLLPEEDDS